MIPFLMHNCFTDVLHVTREVKHYKRKAWLYKIAVCADRGRSTYPY